MQSALRRHKQKSHNEEDEVITALNLAPEKRQPFNNNEKKRHISENVKAPSYQSENLMKERKKNIIHHHKRICKRADETIPLS